MRCDKCGSEIPLQSKFCLSCGNTIKSDLDASPAERSSKKRIKLWAIIAGLCLILVLVIVLSLALRGPKVAGSNTVPDLNNSPVLTPPVTPSAQQPGVLNTDVKKPPLNIQKQEKEVPADVVAYLEHLKRVDQARLALQAKQIGVLFSMIPELKVNPDMTLLLPDAEEAKDPEPPRERAVNQMSDLSKEWQNLSAYFLAVKPPEPCQALASRYYDALRDVIATMGSVQDLVSGGNTGALQQMRGQSSHIDTKLEVADQELSGVCTKYGIEKSFSIRGDTTQTPLLGF